MPTPVNIVAKYNAIQYDGTNSAQIDSLITDFDIISESGGTLLFTSSSAVYSCPTNNHVVYTQGAVTACMTPTEYDRAFTCNLLCSDTGSFLTGQAVRATGVAQVGALLLNQTITIPVTLTPSMPSSTYTANALLFAGSISITGLQINSVTIVSASVVNVVVQSVGVATLAGANVLVNASA